MNHTIACLREEEEMREENNKRNELVHGPTCTTWPPPWLTSTTAPPPRVAAGNPPGPPPSVSPWDLPPELYERWEERVCIMHFDGKIPWHAAEALALADVLGQADPRAGKGEAGPAPQTAKADAPAVQTSMFATMKGPYR